MYSRSGNGVCNTVFSSSGVDQGRACAGALARIACPCCVRVCMRVARPGTSLACVLCAAVCSGACLSSGACLCAVCRCVRCVQLSIQVRVHLLCCVQVRACVLCVGACAAVWCVLSVGACAAVCACVHVQVRSCVCMCALVLLCRHWCVLRLDLLSQTRVRVCSVFRACARVQSWSAPQHAFARVHTTHTVPIHPLTLYFHPRRRTRVCTHVGWCTRGTPLIPACLAFLTHHATQGTSVASDSHTRHRSV